jgi:hypothetical protein
MLQYITQYASDGDEFGFDRASNKPTATSEATDLISAKNVNANDDSFTPMALAA